MKSSLDEFPQVIVSVMSCALGSRFLCHSADIRRCNPYEQELHGSVGFLRLLTDVAGDPFALATQITGPDLRLDVLPSIHTPNLLPQQIFIRDVASECSFLYPRDIGSGNNFPDLDQSWPRSGKCPPSEFVKSACKQKTPILIRESALVPSKAPLQELGR